VYVRNTKPHWKKLEDHGRKIVFVGYERGTKAYRAYDPTTGRVQVTRDAVFDEDSEWDWGAGSDTKSVGANEEFPVHWEITPEAAEDEGEADAKRPSPLGDRGDQFQEEKTPGPMTTKGDHDQELQQVEFGLEDNIDADHDKDSPLWFRAVSDILGPGSPPGRTER
jgi:hypothetical protein